MSLHLTLIMAPCRLNSLIDRGTIGPSLAQRIRKPTREEMGEVPCCSFSTNGLLLQWHQQSRCLLAQRRTCSAGGQCSS